MSFSIIVLLVLSGVVVGFINTLSAGGTVISIALYLAMGIPAQSANAINRIGVLIQNGFSAAIFYPKHLINYKHVLLYSLPLMLGSFVGAMMAVKIDEKIFNICFAIVLLIMIVFMFAKRKEHKQAEQPLTLKHYFICFPFFLLAGFYGGFVQTGTGFLLIAILGSLLGYNLLQTTAAKNTFMMFYTIIAMIVFLIRGEVELKYWIYGLIHSLGAIIGAYIAAKYAIKKGNQFVRWVIVCVIILTAMNLLGVIDLKIILKNLIN